MTTYFLKVLADVKDASKPCVRGIIPELTILICFSVCLYVDMYVYLYVDQFSQELLIYIVIPIYEISKSHLQLFYFNPSYMQPILMAKRSHFDNDIQVRNS